MTKVICKDYGEERKCGCGYRFTRLYAFEGDEKEFDEVGLCGQCFTELLEEFGYQVYKPGEVEVEKMSKDQLLSILFTRLCEVEFFEQVKLKMVRVYAESGKLKLANVVRIEATRLCIEAVALRQILMDALDATDYICIWSKPRVTA